MLTVRLGRLGVGPGTTLLDVGAGFGRHAFEAARRGAHVVALDLGSEEVTATAAMLGAMRAAGEIRPQQHAAAVRADTAHLPFADASFDVVIASEVLEHLHDDAAALAEMARVLRPGGGFSCTVPSWWPEVVNWRLSEEYPAPISAGGHVRIYSTTELRAKVRAAGLTLQGHHRAHALHSPYWWLRCAVGLRRDDHPAVRAYRRLLEWDITARPRALRAAEAALNPVLGKSVVLYASKAVA